MRFHRMNIELQ